MKREDLRAIEGLTDAQVDAIMALAGRDSTAAHAREDALPPHSRAWPLSVRRSRPTWQPLCSRCSNCRPNSMSRLQISASAILPGMLRRTPVRLMQKMSSTCWRRTRH